MAKDPASISSMKSVQSQVTFRGSVISAAVVLNCFMFRVGIEPASREVVPSARMDATAISLVVVMCKC